MTQPILSILIPTLVKRSVMLNRLLSTFDYQITEGEYNGKVEILIESDAGQLPTGTKRNKLLQKATGKYTVFFDDDDEPAPCYIDEIMKAAEEDPDCMAINGVMTTNGMLPVKWEIAIGNPYEKRIYGGQPIYLRWPNHITPMRRTIAQQFKFPDVKHGEDYQWSLDVKNSGLLKTQVIIKKPLYYYRYVAHK